ncbi:glycosyltransferase family 2 protein [Microbacterium bovistercoris]|uniref:Glycosyltransferase family 2 protein n=1 Tax=Microbacterium bovistercoris TaxID=2293570 RepID=A0A371NXK0_9MICO|nr:glycosyltransferase family 2 protein [Microbacterium bovistercoris]REJ08029.1 glycosyltransferase family 2 protein [Microbacterium bovistercoris]
MDRTVVVVVATYRRPEYVRTCLEHLRQQTVSPTRIVVVDASPDDETRTVVREFPEVEYRRNDIGLGATATSRAIGTHDATEDIVAFIDDDAFAEPEWLERLIAAYRPDDVGAVGGRARNGREGEENEGLDRIGRFLRNGRLTGNFAADPGHAIDADHLLGANMSVRNSVLRSLGGIRDFYPGTCLREETDIALRIRKAGYRIVYVPDAVVLHVAGDYSKGTRFDLRYRFYGARNHILLLRTTLGWGDPHLVRYLGSVGGSTARVAVSGLTTWSSKSGPAAGLRGVAGGVIRAGADLAGTVVGLVAAIAPRDRARDVHRATS